MTGIAKAFIVKDKAALRDDLRRLADIPDLVRIIPGHGRVIDSDPSATLHAIAGTL